MAKYETTLRGDFNHFLNYIENEVIQKSMSASYEDGSDYTIGDVRIAVRVFERYSWSGENRVSLSVTVSASKDQIHVTAITSGGSKAVLFKINRIGEYNFLGTLESSVEKYKSMHP